MIYEFLEMAENDIASEAYRFGFLVIADIKNCYGSIYTHSLSWATHGMTFMKSKKRWHNYRLLGNRLDKLFQSSNNDHTTGIPIGPAVSDVVSEILLAQVDIELSKSLNSEKYLAVRFKDDYRILCDTEEDAKKIIKILQRALKSYNLILSDDKTTYYKLPDGIFRNWVSRYYTVNPQPKKYYTYKRLREVFLSVISIERDLPGTGVIDRFLADIITKDYKPNFSVSRKRVSQIISMLLMLPSFRIKSFPKTLGVIESILQSMNDNWYKVQIGRHLARYLGTLASSEFENRYLIIWILYFLRSNRLDRFISKKYRFKDPLVKTVHSSRSNVFGVSRDFKLTVGVIRSSKKRTLLEHLDVFSPQ